MNANAATLRRRTREIQTSIQTYIRRVCQVREYIRVHSHYCLSFIYMDTSPSIYFLSGITGAENLDWKMSIPVEIEYSIGEATARSVALNTVAFLPDHSVIYCQAKTIHPPLTEPTQRCLQLTWGDQLSGQKASCSRRHEMNVRVLRKEGFLSRLDLLTYTSGV